MKAKNHFFVLGLVLVSPSQAIMLKAINSRLLIEQKCPPPLLDLTKQRNQLGNTLEFGINVWTPQPLPAESQYYTRYTCGKP